MYDELARVEANWGSVAEYNRVMSEEMEYNPLTGRYEWAKPQEPTEEEEYREERDYYIHNAKKSALNGKPSEFAVELNNSWDRKEPQRPDVDLSSREYNKWFYDVRDWAHDKRLDIFSKLCKYYGVECTDNGKDFYRKTEEYVGKFAIEVEYVEHGNILGKYIVCLDYEMFKNLFRDLWFCGCNPTMRYCSSIEHSKILSNSSLGGLIMYDLKWLGVETEESINATLKEYGFNEDAVVAEFDKRWGRGDSLCEIYLGKGAETT